MVVVKPSLCHYCTSLHSWYSSGTVMVCPGAETVTINISFDTQQVQGNIKLSVKPQRVNNKYIEDVWVKNISTFVLVK